MTRLMRRLDGRFAVILSGEATQSLFHFGLNIALVRKLSMHDYGLFAMVFIVGAVGITYIRALVAVPATLYLPGARGRGAERVHDVTFGSGAALLALVMGAGVTLVLAPALGLGAAAGGAFVGAWAFRSYLRIVLLARGRSRIAGLSDVVFTLSGACLAAMFLWGEGLGLLDHAFLAVAIAHAIATGVALLALRQPIRFSARASVRRRYRRIWPTLAWSLVGITTINVQAQGLTLVLALMAGPAAYAPIAATLVLFAPLRIPTNALTNMTLPDLSALLARGRVGEARRLVARRTGFIALGCLAYGAIMLACLPVVERSLFAGRFAGEPMSLIALAVWLIVSVSLLYAVPRAFLEAAGSFKAIAIGALGSALIGFVVMSGLMTWFTPTLALLGLLVSETVTVLWSADGLRRHARGQALSARQPGPHRGMAATAAGVHA